MTRLSFPLGYWNGLGVFVALGIPLLLRAALVGRDARVRAIALAPIPVLAAVIYLTSSRGGVGTALLGAVVFLALTERRWRAAAPSPSLSSAPPLRSSPCWSATSSSMVRSELLSFAARAVKRHC